jgi:hypothetical protein
MTAGFPRARSSDRRLRWLHTSEALHARWRRRARWDCDGCFARKVGEHFLAAEIIGAMPRYAINPPLHVRGSPGRIIRSTDDAVRFVRATSNPDDAAAIQLVARLESVRNAEIAQRLANELRIWINRRGLSRVAH